MENLLIFVAAEQKLERLPDWAGLEILKKIPTCIHIHYTSFSSNYCGKH